jgi:ribosome maturation factor RimP
MTVIRWSVGSARASLLLGETSVPEAGQESLFVEAFNRIVHAIPHDPDFGAIEIVQATARAGGRDAQLSVLVDREGGVDVDTCERIAARINRALDAFPNPYTLEVSSAGLNRPLVKPDDYDRFAGSNVRILTTSLIAGAKTHRGVLVGVRQGSVVVRVGANEILVPLDAIKAANIEYDIRADLQRAKREKKPS